MTDFFRSDGDTPVRRQGEKETHGDVHRDPPPWKEGDAFGEFVLEKLLGSGSSGFVYRVFDKTTRRHIALKILRLGNVDALMRNRIGFRRMMQIEHPNLLYVDRIHKVGEYTALAMEQIHGTTFDKAVQELERRPRDEAFQTLFEWMRDFASGLAVMHSSGLIHCDIKPQNLMVDERGRGRVIDYGLVNTFDLDRSDATVGNVILGTPHYLAPEVICRQIYLPAGDIFALGIVMLEAMQSVAISHRSNAAHDESSYREFVVGDSEHGDIGRGGHSTEQGIERNETGHVDAKLISGVLNDLFEHVPEAIGETCREMLDQDASERPTAMRLSRLGMPPAPMTLSDDHSLIGRAAPLDEIKRWADRVFAGKVSRLHITGPSGIGKTRLLDEAIASIEAKNWGQVFRGRCRLREDSAMQAFEQICDAIADRYRKADRERIKVDSVCYEVLSGIFPVLKPVMNCCLEMTPISAPTERLNSLEAGIRLSMQIREIGPLFIVIDDSQWADQDSLNVLDGLQMSGGDVGLGIITVSRTDTDRQQVSADLTVALDPISTSYLVEHLRSVAERRGIPVSEDALYELAELTGGSPLRLHELANEFRPGGVLSEINFENSQDNSVTEIAGIEQLWQRRLQRLSEAARQTLLFIVTAGGRVSTDQLGELTGQGDDVDSVVSELSQLRLILDEATGGECISIFHDRLADQWIDSLSEQERKKAHAAWASYLVRQDNPESLAARIAGHWFTAGQPGRAVSHAILAAEDAERRIAKTEAARWHWQVVPHLSGEEKVYHARQAAHRYREADRPVEAAQCFQALAELVDDDERLDCELLAAIMLLRSGRYQMVRESLKRCTRRLRVPRPKPPWSARISILFEIARLKWHRESLVDLVRRSPHEVSDESACNRLSASQEPSNAHVWDTDESHARSSKTRSSKAKQLVERRIDLCLALERPLSMLDNLYAAELNLAGARLSRKHGTFDQRVGFAVGSAVFRSYDDGPHRREALSDLNILLTLAQQSGRPKPIGDVWAATTYAYFFACQWDRVAAPLASSIASYRKVETSQGFEILHVQWTGMWTNWILGEWEKLTHTAEEMFEESSRRNDGFQKQIIVGGMGGNAWLVRDRYSELQHQRDRVNELKEVGSGEILDYFDRIGRIYTSIYHGDFEQAWKICDELRTQTKWISFVKIQCFRITTRSLTALVGIHLYAEDGDAEWLTRVHRETAVLRSEEIPYGRTLADFYDGLLLCCGSGSGTAATAPLDSGAAAEKSQIIAKLTQVGKAAEEMQLLPIQLAAADIVTQLRDGESRRLLISRMTDSGVIEPQKLARLYTVDVMRQARNSS